MATFGNFWSVWGLEAMCGNICDLVTFWVTFDNFLWQFVLQLMGHMVI